MHALYHDGPEFEGFETRASGSNSIKWYSPNGSEELILLDEFNRRQDIMQAAQAGARVERQYRSDRADKSIWYYTPEPSWDWFHVDYRLAPGRTQGDRNSRALHSTRT
ncbi:hypothetical protein [Xanthomonas phage JGB6]|nr:hypothetical protein [Xanthomonas phage JGB6]